MFDEAAYSPETIAIAQGLHDFRRSNKKLTLFIFKTLARNLQSNPKEKSLITNTYNKAPNLSFLVKLSRDFVNEYKAPKYSRDAENQLDNQEEKAENEDEAETPEKIENGIFQTPPKAQAAFEKHLSDEDQKLAKENIAKQIGENVKDFNSLVDPVEFDAAFSKLPFVKAIRIEFNMNRTQRDESQKNRCAVSYEYARRCFLNDPRVKRAIIHEIYSNRKQSGVEVSLRQGTSGRTGRKGNSVQSINSRTFATPGLGAFNKIHKQFTDLVSEMSSN